MASKRKYLSDEEIANIMQNLSDTESDISESDAQTIDSDYVDRDSILNSN